MSKAQAIVPFAEIAEANNIPIESWSALTTSLYPGARPESVVLVYNYCLARKLDPLKRPVHIVPMSVKNAINGKFETRDVVMPGINETRTTATRTEMMAGSDDPVFGPEEDFPISTDKSIKNPVMIRVPAWCKVTVHRLDKTGVPRAYTHTEYFAEAVARTRDGVINATWMKRPRGMLAKCAEAGALRKAFPEEVGGELVMEEMIGKTIGEEGAPAEPIEGDFKIVEKTVEQPVEKKPDAKPTEQAAAPAQDRGAAAPAAAPASAPAPAPAPTAAPAAEGGAKLVIDLTAGPPLRMLRAKLVSANLSQDDFLKGFGKSVSLSNINEAFEYIKGAADGQS